MLRLFPLHRVLKTSDTAGVWTMCFDDFGANLLWGQAVKPAE